MAMVYANNHDSSIDRNGIYQGPRDNYTRGERQGAYLPISMVSGCRGIRHVASPPPYGGGWQVGQR